MRAFWLCGLLAGICWTGAAQSLRTPDGMLWAGSTFSLRAVATTHDGRPLHVSNQATVTVGEVIHWRVAVEGESAQTVTSSEGWFTLLIQNRSNTVDALNLRIKTQRERRRQPMEHRPIRTAGRWLRLQQRLAADRLHLVADAWRVASALSARAPSKRPQHRRRVDYLDRRLATRSDTELVA
jgi:hypothetical protein